MNVAGNGCVQPPDDGPHSSFLGYPINDEVANIVTASCFSSTLQTEQEISICISTSPGGSVYSGLGVYDTMQYVTPDVATICIGMAASMACVLLGAGTKVKERH